MQNANGLRAPTDVKVDKTLVESRPRRDWVQKGETGGMPFISEQDGRFWTPDGKPLAMDKVPPAVRAAAQASPLANVRLHEGVRTAIVCEHCGQSFLSDELSEHLMDALRSQSTTTFAKPPEIPGLDD